ncbi:unknown [Clostridium sp. CAG:440]|nr:unknown [Clostridium sp. CAG:440]
MNYKNTLEEIKKEMRIRAITDEILAEQIKMPKEKLKRKLDGIDVIEVDELVDILSYLELSVNRVTEIYEKYKKQE